MKVLESVSFQHLGVVALWYTAIATAMNCMITSSCNPICRQSIYIKLWYKHHITVCFYHKYLSIIVLVAHGRVVTSSRQITEAKQRWARLVLGWVTAGARVTLSAMCRGVGQAFHIMPPLSTQQWWVPGGTNNGELWMAIAAENALNSPQRRWDRTRESFTTRGVNCEVCWTQWDIRL